MPNVFSQMWQGFLGLFDGIPEGVIAVTVYVGGTLLALWAWYNVVRRLPSGLAVGLWMFLLAMLATPTVSEGPNAGLAPAIIGLVFGVVTKDKSLVIYNLMSMILVFGLGMLVAYLLNLYWLKRRAA